MRRAAPPPVPALAAVLAALLGLGVHAHAGAQVSAALELRPGGGIGQYDAARGELDTAPRPAWRVGATLSFHPLIHLVAGYGHTSFGCEGGFCTDTDVRFASAGPEVGVRIGAGGSRFGPWAQAELIAHSVRSTWRDGAESSERGLGWGLAAGVHFPVAARIALSPALRVQTYSAAMAPDPEPYRVSLAAAELGVRVRVR